MDNDLRLPSSRKLERRIMLIERLWNQIIFYTNHGTPAESKAYIEKNYPDWKIGEGYGDLIHAARSSLRSPFNHYIEGSFDDGIWSGTVSRSERKNPDVLIDYKKIIGLITESTYLREIKAKSSEEEIRQALDTAISINEEEFDRVYERLEKRLPRDIDTIRHEVRRKVNKFLSQRDEKISAESG